MKPRRYPTFDPIDIRLGQALKGMVAHASAPRHARKRLLNKAAALTGFDLGLAARQHVLESLGLASGEFLFGRVDQITVNAYSASIGIFHLRR